MGLGSWIGSREEDSDCQQRTGLELKSVRTEGGGGAQWARTQSNTELQSQTTNNMVEQKLF